MLQYDWTSEFGYRPSGMTVYLFGSTTGLQTDLTNDVSTSSFSVSADSFKLMTFNLSPSEYSYLRFYNTNSYDSIRVQITTLQDHTNATWEGSTVYAQEPDDIGVSLDTFSIDSVQVARGDTVIRQETPLSLLSTLHVKVRVDGLSNMSRLAGAITGMAAGCYLSHPELSAGKCNLYLDKWSSTLDNDSTKDGWTNMSIRCFGLPQDKRDVSQRDSTLNVLTLAFTLKDGSLKTYTFNVGDKIKYYETTDEGEVTVDYVTQDLWLILDGNIVLPDVKSDNSSGFDAEVDPWEDGGNTDVIF
jgi:hypothetical protein